MSSLKKNIGRASVLTPIIGLIMGFTWIFGEYFSTRLLDLIESKSSSAKKRDDEPS